MAYIKAHFEEGRTNVSVEAEDLTIMRPQYAQGSIIAFMKDIPYQSGRSLFRLTGYKK
jgi:hypothetical protein